MDDVKWTLRHKAEAYQRRMQEAHERRLKEEVADLALSLDAKAADVSTLAAALTGPAAHPDRDPVRPSTTAQFTPP